MRLQGFTLLVCAFLLVSRAAQAQMTGLTDDRTVVANVLYLGTSDHKAASAPTFFGAWNDFVDAFVPGPLSGSSESTAFQSSLFYISGLLYSGSANGSWNVNPGEHYDARSHLRWKVRANQCLEYSIHSEVTPGDLPRSAWVEVRGSGGRVFYNEGGVVDTTGRVSSGDYVFEGESSVDTSVETREGGTYSLQWDCHVCPSTPIGVEPSDVSVSCDATATFCVVPAGPVQNFTYQWRRNGVPVANGTHYAGATGNCFSIFHACWADTGFYDVLVTSAGITTPSRAVRLNITSTPVGIEPGAFAWSLGPPTPNPSFAGTSLRYESPRPFHAVVTVHDAAGRMVRRLANRMLAASGSLTWDGLSDAGTPAVPGVYFLRVETDGRSAVRRIARVR